MNKATQSEIDFVISVIKREKDEFLKKREDGVYVFKRFNEASLRAEYSYYIKGTCCLCGKDHYKRRSNKRVVSHNLCRLRLQAMGRKNDFKMHRWF
jgi:hypothetical protein